MMPKDVCNQSVSAFSCAAKAGTASATSATASATPVAEALTLTLARDALRALPTYSLDFCDALTRDPNGQLVRMEDIESVIAAIDAALAQPVQAEPNGYYYVSVDGLPNGPSLRVLGASVVDGVRCLRVALPTAQPVQAEPTALRTAALAVLGHMVGELPVRGYLRDNDRSRAALGALAAAARSAT